MPKVLFMSRPGNASPWLEDFSAALGPADEVVVWDPGLDFAPQVAGAVAVADLRAPLTPGMFEAALAAGVRLWQVVGAGYDHIDPGWIGPSTFPIANTPGEFSAPALAEHALMLMLNIARRFPSTQEQLAEGRFFRIFADELAGKTLGVVGLGASGTALATAARGLGMKVLAISRRGSGSGRAALPGIELVGGPEQLEALLASSDYVSIHVPLTAATRGLIGAAQLRAMKPTAVLINVARGGIVDQAALLEALRDGTIRAAGLDVFAVEPIPPQDPLLALENVVATPHVGGSTHETSRRRGAAAADNVRRAVSGVAPLHRVLAPPRDGV